MRKKKIEILEEKKSINEEKISFSKNLNVIETFSKEDFDFIEKIKKKEFEPLNLLKIKLKAEEVAKQSEIKELISYPLIKKNLKFNLPHQQEGALRILNEFDGRALLADEVGLGKTITAGMVLKECLVRGFIKRVLILTPPSLVNQWKEELKTKFELDFKEVETERDWDNKFVIASIDKVKSFQNKKNKFKHSKAHEIYWDLIIIDEAHKLKDKKTFRWRFVDKLQKKRLLLLTATPFQNNLIELYNLLSLLRRGHLGTISEFRKNFLVKGNERYPLNPRELKRKLSEVMIRRRRDEVTGIKYIKRIPKIQSVELSLKEKRVYEEISDMLFLDYFDFKGNKINTTLAAYSILPKITSSSKSAIEFLENLISNPKYHSTTKDIASKIMVRIKGLDQDTKIGRLIELVNEIDEKSKNEKILIYTKHPATLKYISKILREQKFHVTEFKGGLTKDEKSKRVLEFKMKSQILVSTETGSEGLNFQFCSNLINYDLPWNPMAVEQRIGRLDRIGQKKNIIVNNLATKGTMEEYVVDLIINKMCCIGLVMGELPIILFNMGLDSSGKHSSNKFEEKIMNAFLSSKNNLNRFAKEIEKVGYQIEKGIKDYDKTKKYTSELID